MATTLLKFPNTYCMTINEIKGTHEELMKNPLAQLPHSKSHQMIFDLNLQTLLYTVF